jgi:hypothetical protein
VVRVRMIKSLQVTFYISTNVQFTCSKMSRYIEFIILYVNHTNILVSFNLFCSIVCIKRGAVLEAGANCCTFSKTSTFLKFFADSVKLSRNVLKTM